MRQASFSDYEAIALLETAVGLTPPSRERWLHLWQDNPAYVAIPDWPIGWVLEDHDGRIVGCIGNIPAEYHLGGRKYVSATFVGWAVDPGYRAFSLLLVMHQLQHPSVDLQIVTTAGPMPQVLFTKLGWSRVPVGQWDQAAYWITNYAGALDGYLETKTSSAAARIVKACAAAPLQLVDRMRAAREPAWSHYDIRWFDRVDDTFDRFWTELLELNPTRFLASRTKESVKWHVDRMDAWILTAFDKTRLVGYAILQRKDARSVRLTRMMLVDFQTLHTDPELSAAMMASALDRCRRERIHLLENVGCWLEKLQPIGNPAPQHRGLEAWCYLYKSRNPDLTRELQVPEAWYPTQYDGDGSL